MLERHRQAMCKSIYFLFSVETCGGNAAEAACVFPFTYRGTEYESARRLITISPGVQLNQETTPVMAKMGKLQLCKRR
jgi:hypothetical protein